MGSKRQRLIYVPHSHVIHEEKPSFACCLCERVFFQDEARQYQDHVIRGHSHEELREHSLQAQAPGLFDQNHPASGDVEWHQWIDRHAAAGADPKRYMRTDDGK